MPKCAMNKPESLWCCQHCTNSAPVTASLHWVVWKAGNFVSFWFCLGLYVDGSMQERRNSNANALMLRLSRINPSIYQQAEAWVKWLPFCKHFQMCFIKRKYSFKFLLKFVLKNPINKSELVQAIPWHRPGTKPLSKPIKNNLIDTHMHHWDSVSEGIIYRVLLVRTTLRCLLWHINNANVKGIAGATLDVHIDKHIQYIQWIMHMVYVFFVVQ